MTKILNRKVLNELLQDARNGTLKLTGAQDILNLVTDLFVVIEGEQGLMELALRVMGYVVSGNATFLVKIHKKFVEELTPLLSKEYDLETKRQIVGVLGNLTYKCGDEFKTYLPFLFKEVSNQFFQYANIPTSERFMNISKV
ncbi:MAG: hypothetical protein EZS28_016167 [Streblomastix strix]|uniref:Uncharacterized protein n=1 Tax=Streblomastix strix TaxID=222440 RepID=A0A5J4W0C8_9EUKA|nr:MAG: hypothetical protein EZS28_016167 [Streblomastix strix]